jgi:hypothetical protein
VDLNSRALLFFDTSVYAAEYTWERMYQGGTMGTSENRVMKIKHMHSAKGGNAI